jgi:ABC-type lipoprotein export system ATPase subunit
MDPLVELEQVGFGYTRRAMVLEDVSMTIADGSTHAITGRSGCGKSTLLYLAGLMLRPTSGHVRLAGVDHARPLDSTRARARADLVGFVFQDALLDTSLSVWENLLEGLPWNRPRRAYAERCEHSLERLGLTDLRRHSAARLSGGQAQRVALIRAMAKQPVLLLADEPTGNLDPDTAKVVLTELLEYGRGTGHATVIVTHDPHVADLCDHTHHLPAHTIDAP